MSRKSQITITVFTVISTLSLALSGGTPIIGGYLVPAPAEVLQPLNLPTPTAGGVKMTYSGYSDYTNKDGYFSFPKHHADHELRIIVCAETDYDTLKETVSQIRVNSKIQSPAISVYRVTKQKEDLSEKEPKPLKKAPPATPKEEKPQTGTPPDKKEAGAEDSTNNNIVWSYIINAVGSTVPADGIRSTDLIIHCDPSMIYMQDKSYYYASTEETSHFILPTESIFLLKTPPAPTLERTDIMTESTESSIETDTVANKSNDTDSMGNPLPGVVRSARSNTD